jgi:Mg/Co/Ni transporter MgtE
VPYASELVDTDPPHCALSDDLTTVRLEVEASPYGFCLVLGKERIVLGRVRRSALSEAASDATAEDMMEPGPGTVRASTPASELVERLAKRDLETALVTTPRGRLIGIFDRRWAEKRLGAAESERA